jgi:hypothetical protein
MTDAASPPLTLDDEMKAAIGAAFASGNSLTVGYVGDDGWPHISRRGTVQVLGSQQLALWARKPDDGLARAMASHPEVTLFYIDLTIPQLYTFYGRGKVSADEDVRDVVYEGSPPREQARDPERQGVPVVVELERIEALGARKFLMVRSA